MASRPRQTIATGVPLIAPANLGEAPASTTAGVSEAGRGIWHAAMDRHYRWMGERYGLSDAA